MFRIPSFEHYEWGEDEDGNWWVREVPWVPEYNGQKFYCSIHSVKWGWLPFRFWRKRTAYFHIRRLNRKKKREERSQVQNT